MIVFSKIKTLSVISFLLFNYCRAQDTQGFFVENIEPKKAVIPDYVNYVQPSANAGVSVVIDKTDTLATVSKYIYGNNANIYMTSILGQPNLPDYIKNLSPNILRYPGGNISNQFFWNARPGELPATVPEEIRIMPDFSVKEKYWFGNNQADSTLSVDKYYKMLDFVGSEGIICVNYSYARYGLGKNPVADAAHLAAEWVRYDKGRTKLWEIGNENYGAWQAGYRIDTTLNRDGQPTFINGSVYGKHFNVFADSMRKAAKEIGVEIKLGAVMIESPKPWADKMEQNWNNDFFRETGNSADFFIVHSYYTPYEQDSDIPTILNSAFSETKLMKDYMLEVCKENRVEPKPLALTEWNIFAIKSKQSCSFVNGMHATLVLGELIKNQYGQATRWNLANAYANGDDHGMFNQGDEPGIPLWNPRPVYFYMYYFQKFFGNYMVKSEVSGSNDIITYASRFDSGETGLIIVNKGEKPQIVNINSEGSRFYFYSLSGGTDNGNFSQSVFINGNAPSFKSGGPILNLKDLKAFSSKTDDEIKIESPAYSVQFILIE